MGQQDPSSILQTFARNLRRIRTERNLSQEALAHIAGLDKAHIGYFEQLRNSPTLDTVGKIAEALNVPVAELFTLMVGEDEEDIELARLNALLPYVRRYQELADEYKIDDVFQDNGGKLLQTLLLTGLKNLPGRQGNDAIDNEDVEWELKTVNVRNKKRAGQFTTNHHLTIDILAKYRLVKWLFCVYEGIEIVEIWILTQKNMQPLFQHWEQALEVAQQKRTDGKLAHLNNAKINLSYVRQHGILYYRDAADDAVKPTKKLAYFPKEQRPVPPTDLFGFVDPPYKPTSSRTQKKTN